MKKTLTLTNKPFCLGLSIQELSKILMYQLCKTKMVKKQNCVIWIQTV